MVSMQSLLRALVRFSFLQLVAGTPAAPPGSIVILEPGENSFTIQWSPGASNDCTFQAWQVQVRSRNLNGTLVGSWRQATEVPTSRDSPNCTVDGLQRNSPYDLQIFERCANGADDSSAGEPEQVLWTLPGYWEIHIPPHDSSSYVVEDTLEAHAGCEVIKSCCDDQFSLCFSGNESRTVEVQRVDTELGWWQQVGWGQDLYLRCHAPSVAAFKDDPISKEVPEPPWYLRLYEPSHVTAQVVFHHGDFIGGCQCANHQLQTRPQGSSTWRNESGDCLFRDQRHCNIQELQANARIYGRMQTTCLDESMNSNWSEVVEVITRPACTWTYDSSIQGAAANELECVDKTFCDFDADSSCCSSAGGRLRCPQNYPIMCENQDCVGSTDYCCVSTESECGNYGGVRVCTASMVPAEVTVLNETARTRRLSVRLTLEVEVVSSAGSVAMLSSELGKEMLHTELLESWDEKGLALDFSVLVSSVETQETTQATLAPNESAVEQAPNVSNLAVLVVVLCTFLCSAAAGALYCWRWQRGGATVVPQSPKLQPPTSPCPIAPGAESLKSPKGGASPAAVSAMRRAASQSDATKPTLTLPLEARKVVPEPRASNASNASNVSNAGSEQTTEAVGMTEEANDMKERLRPTSLQVRVVQPGEKPSARAVRVTNATVTRSCTAVSSSSRSPLSHPPRPSGDVSTAGSLTQRTSRSEPHRLPLEPMDR